MFVVHSLYPSLTPSELVELAEIGFCGANHTCFCSVKSYKYFMSGQLESVKWITSFRGTGENTQRGKAHGPVIQGKRMNVYADPLFYWWWQKASVIYHYSASYCTQSCEIPVRGKDYLEGSRGRQRTVGKTQNLFLSKAGRMGDPEALDNKHVTCVTASHFHAKGRHYWWIMPTFPVEDGDRWNVLVVTLQAALQNHRSWHTGWRWKLSPKHIQSPYSKAVFPFLA